MVLESQGTRDAPSDAGAVPLGNWQLAVGERRRAKTRERIIEAAAAVYAEKGPEAPVIDDFVRAAGMSRGSFYNHFTTTQGLLQATVEWYANDLAAAIVALIEGLDDPVERTCLAMRTHLHWVTFDPRICAFFAKVPQVGEAGRRTAMHILQQGIDTGAFRVPNLEVACDLSFGVLAETVRRVARSPEAPKHCDEAVWVILAGLGVAPEKIRRVMASPTPSPWMPPRLSALLASRGSGGAPEPPAA